MGYCLAKFVTFPDEGGGGLTVVEVPIMEMTRNTTPEVVATTGGHFKFSAVAASNNNDSTVTSPTRGSS